MHARITGRVVRRLYDDDAVRPDSEVPIAQALHLLGRKIELVTEVFNEHEVVAKPVHLDEFDFHQRPFDCFLDSGKAAFPANPERGDRSARQQTGGTPYT